KIIDHNQLILVVAHDTKRHRSTRSTLFPYTTLFRSDEGDTVIIEYLDGQWSSETGKAPLSSGCGKKWHDPVKEHVWVFPPDEIGDMLIGYINNQPFKIGCQPVTFQATTSGELYLGMNDCTACYW